MNENRYYVYEWYVKDTNEVFYVGKGTKRRAGQLKENKYFMSMYNTHDCDYRIVIDELTEEQAFQKEMELNKTDGTFIKKFDTVTQASAETGISIKLISRNANGKSKSTHGFIFKYC